MKYFLLSILSFSVFGQEIFLKDVSKTYNLGITHNQGLSLTNTLSGTASAFEQSCTGQDCDFLFDTKGDYTLSVNSVDELGLASSQAVNIKVGDYICEEVTYYEQTELASTNETQTCVYKYNPDANESDECYYMHSTGLGGFITVNWLGANYSSINDGTANNGDTLTKGGWTYVPGTVRETQTPGATVRYREVSRERGSPATCGTPNSSTKTICYPSSETNYLSVGSNDLGTNSGHSSCSNNYIDSTGAKKVYISGDTSSWSDANTDLNTTILPTGTLIIDGSVDIGEDLGSL